MQYIENNPSLMYQKLGLCNGEGKEFRSAWGVVDVKSWVN
jgi:hypothetical protein